MSRSRTTQFKGTLLSPAYRPAPCWGGGVSKRHSAALRHFSRPLYRFFSTGQCHASWWWWTGARLGVQWRYMGSRHMNRSCALYNAGFRDPVQTESDPKTWFSIGPLEASEIQLTWGRAKTLRPRGTDSLWITRGSSWSQFGETSHPRTPPSWVCTSIPNTFSLGLNALWIQLITPRAVNFLESRNFLPSCLCSSSLFMFISSTVFSEHLL